MAFYNDKTEPDHVEFANQAIRFFEQLAAKNKFFFESTTDWAALNKDKLKQFRVILWLNDAPQKPEQRAAFESYMEHGGSWMGFHYAGYNDDSTNWPWFVEFLGGGVFYGNNWPPLPAALTIDDPSHPVTHGLQAGLLAPANEWYIWKPSPRRNKDVKVLLTLAPQNYPLGLKDLITGGDDPVVWTNTQYRMVYLNMGHGGQIFTSPEQNKLFENAVLWLGSLK